MSADLVLTRHQRDVLYDSVMFELSGLGGILLMLETRKGTRAPWPVPRRDAPAR